MKKHNFFAGPAILPESVLEKASKAALRVDELGLSILEISHRSDFFVKVMEDAESLVRELLGLNDDLAVLFLTGGASSQFFMTPLNLLAPNESAAYIDTGTWSSKAIKEARHFGDIQITASSEDNGYNYIPKDLGLVRDDYRYVHLTSNNTIYGTQIKDFPNISHIVCDMSSDIFSRIIDVEKYDLIYAGAQKNLGPSGVTIVIVRKDILGKTGRTIPTILDYQTHISKKSSFNTPPVFPIYVSMLTLEWIKANGGVRKMEIRNAAKAQMLYAEIDRNSCFKGAVVKEDRSVMNVCFLPENPDMTQPFLDICAEYGIMGLKGHRSVGGFRASLYNALPIESVSVLVDAMKELENKHA